MDDLKNTQERYRDAILKTVQLEERTGSMKDNMNRWLRHSVETPDNRNAGVARVKKQTWAMTAEEEHRKILTNTLRQRTGVLAPIQSQHETSPRQNLYDTNDETNDESLAPPQNNRRLFSQ